MRHGHFSAPVAALVALLVAGGANAAANTAQCKSEGASSKVRLEIFSGLLFDRGGRLRQPFPTRGAGQVTIRISGDGQAARRLRGEIEIVAADLPTFNVRVPAKRGPRTIVGKIAPAGKSFALSLDGPDVAFRGACAPRRGRR